MNDERLCLCEWWLEDRRTGAGRIAVVFFTGLPAVVVITGRQVTFVTGFLGRIKRFSSLDWGNARETMRAVEMAVVVDNGAMMPREHGKQDD